MDAMPSDENQPFLRMEDFQQFPGYGMPQPTMPWESYGIMMDPFSSPVMTVPVYVQERKPSSTVAEKNPQIAAPQGPDAIRSKLRDSLTEALKMVAGEHPKEKILAFLNGGGVVDSNHDFEAPPMVVEESLVPHAKRSKLQVFGGKGSSSPSKRMRMDSDELGFRWEERVTEHARLVSKNIEIELLRVFKAVNRKYKEKARSLVFNLKDKNNPDLRARVFVGEVSPEQLCSMTIEQLASKELSQWRMAKAEERAQKVVITDEDVNPSKIVKKTHKGEIIMEVDSDAPVAPVKEVEGGDVSASASEDAAQERSEDEEEKEGEEEEGTQEKEETADEKVVDGKERDAEMVDAKEADDATTDATMVSAAREAVEAPPLLSDTGDTIPDEGGAAGGESFEASSDPPLLDVSDFKGLPEIMSMDGFLKSLGCTTGGDTKAVDVKKEGEEVTEAIDGSKADEKASGSATTTAGNSLKRKLGDNERKQNDKSSSPSRKQSPINGEEKPLNLQLWEGSLQLTGTRSTAVHGMFRSGRHDVKLDAWPKQLEVKGRVKLGPLAKFLKDLCNSKSRAVTVMSFYSSDMATSSLSLLKEVADQYEKGERVGYVEPGTGYELYLFPPGKATWKFLTENGRLKPSADLPKDKSEVLVGCVVWRKNPSDKSSSESRKPSSAEKSKRGSSRAPSSKHSRGKSSSSTAAPSTATATIAAPPPPSLASAKHPSPSRVKSVSPSQSQSVVKQHSVNEWHQQSSLCSPTPAATIAESALPPPPFLEGLLPPGFHPSLLQALTAVLPGSTLPGYDGGPPGFWQQQQQQQQQEQQCKDGNDLPEFEYEGYIPMPGGGGGGGGGGGLEAFHQLQGGGESSFRHHHLYQSSQGGFHQPPAEAYTTTSEGLGMQWPRPTAGGGNLQQQQQALQVLGSHHQQQQDSSSNPGGGFPVLRPPLPPGPPPPPSASSAAGSGGGGGGGGGGGTAAANSSYGQWVHPNQAAHQKTLHYKKASVAAPSQQRRHRS
ncbi:death-inducer obliterator 1-like [Selaginella moellendorffii]|uniref:death-inducer obliterator 1-like n=1 Tax=Selaginella moellendorffii TaxID=88036 RepID=UPI000D1C9BB7|nr:death-inducer obliterator 1-like [Selaginella moellendorffii]|eukprot:XP_024540849.1 death-inducer obliterator 1-like [Selaginella moellendorffii]